METYEVLFYKGDKYEFEWTKEQYESVAALDFLLHALARLELFKIYKNGLYQKSYMPHDNTSIIQIFPVSNPYESYLRREPGKDALNFLEEVKEGTNLSAKSMTLGKEYLKNFRLPVALLSWGFPHSVPSPPWNGIALLIHITEESLMSLEEMIKLLGEDPNEHIIVFE